MSSQRENIEVAIENYRQVVVNLEKAKMEEAAVGVAFSVARKNSEEVIAKVDHLARQAEVCRLALLKAAGFVPPPQVLPG